MKMQEIAAKLGVSRREVTETQRQKCLIEPIRARIVRTFVLSSPKCAMVVLTHARALAGCAQRMGGVEKVPPALNLARNSD